MFPKVELMAGCHFAREDAEKLQKGLRLRFLESHTLENICVKGFGDNEPEFRRGNSGGVGCELAIRSTLGAILGRLNHVSSKVPGSPRVTGT